MTRQVITGTSVRVLPGTAVAVSSLGRFSSAVSIAIVVASTGVVAASASVPAAPPSPENREAEMIVETNAVRPAGPLVSTYSIVARDPATGDLGVAVQSHWFSVGQVVTWAEAGVGAVATQSLVEVSYGPLGLALMRSGKGAALSLEMLLAADEEKAVRQVAIVDATGRVAAWTGPKCIPEAGDAQGAQFSVQANLMDKDTVWPAMKKAYENAEGDLADRMMAALEAAENEGGDIRGRQSAAILIVSGKKTNEPWSERRMELRVEDHPKPLEELRRLIRIHRAYDHAGEGDRHLGSGDVEAAMASYGRAAEILPENLELRYWKAVGLWNAGHRDEALPVFREVFAEDSRWARLTPRLAPTGLLEATPEEIRTIIAGTESAGTKPTESSVKK